MAEQLHDESQGPARRGAGKIPPPVLAAFVLAICVATGILVFLLYGSRSTRIMSEAPRATYEPEWLDIPVMEIKDVALSVPLEASGAQRKQLTVGVAVRFAPAEGRSWSGGLPREVGRRLGNLKPEFRHIIIEEINAKTYAQLSSKDGLNRALQDLKRRFEDRLAKCDLSGSVSVHEVMWSDLFWN